MTDINLSDDHPDNLGEPLATPSVSPPDSLQVEVGNAMPVAQPNRLPTLNAQPRNVALLEANEDSPSLSKVADGINFVGNAILRGPCSIAGNVQGNLTQAPDTQVAVVVTQTGRVTGDITAQKISVMGKTNGILDSGQGEVTLHDSASVEGLVRYGRIQVNGADLNATLERVPMNKTGG
jgi:cytoskeletal protein CcmA (bactofilin family)